MPVAQFTPAQRTAAFWSKVDFNGPVPAARPDLGPCWLWHGSLVKGYGSLVVDHPVNRRKTGLAHRVAYEWVRGPIPAGLTLDHLCRVRRCVNPFHLEPVTNRENILRGESPAAQHTRVTACPQGHPYDHANTWIRIRRGGPQRVCRTCERIRWRRWYAAKVSA